MPTQNTAPQTGTIPRQTSPGNPFPLLKGEGQEGGCLSPTHTPRQPPQHLPNRLDNRRCLAAHLAVGESQNAEALTLHFRRSGVVVFLLTAVLVTVDLEDQACLNTGEVRDISTKWVLASEPIAFHLSEPQMSPENSLGVRHVAA